MNNSEITLEKVMELIGLEAELAYQYYKDICNAEDASNENIALYGGIAHYLDSLIWMLQSSETIEFNIELCKEELEVYK